jgi:8-oxo-dGTP pyrophosphatase MutT (NUDIX family)
MQEYVVVYARSEYPNQVLLVEKDRPAWQKGRYNLPGGKIEPGETPLACAIRELGEEAGYEPDEIHTLQVATGKIAGSWGVVHCVPLGVKKKEPKPKPGETERLFWADWDDVRDDVLLIPNLKLTVPLMMKGVINWVILDEGCSEVGRSHTVSITL